MNTTKKLLEAAIALAHIDHEAIISNKPDASGYSTIERFNNALSIYNIKKNCPLTADFFKANGFVHTKYNSWEVRLSNKLLVIEEDPKDDKKFIAKVCWRTVPLQSALDLEDLFDFIGVEFDAKV